MLQLEYAWNIAGPLEKLEDQVKDIKYRGWLKTDPIPLPSPLLSAVRSKLVPKNLPVGDLCARWCPTKRETFFALNGERGDATWGRIAGDLAEQYFRRLVSQFFSKQLKRPPYTYESLKKAVEVVDSLFAREHSTAIAKLQKYRINDSDDPNWFVSNLSYSGKHELAAQELGTSLEGYQLIKTGPREEAIPVPDYLGIGLKSSPDFIFSDLRAIGDMKIGNRLENRHLLACAGYALAYECEKKVPIDFGLAFLFPTNRKVLSHAQVHIFVIDDDLRMNFLNERNDVYNSYLKNKGGAPEFPTDTSHCPTCKFRSRCEKDGLKIK